MPINTLFKHVNLILIMLLLISGLQINTAPVSAAPASAGLSVESLLKPDGTLNTQGGVSGSLSLAGWDVSLDPARGPVFAPSGSGASNSWGPVRLGSRY